MKIVDMSQPWKKIYISPGKYVYCIMDFEWDEGTNTFSGDEEMLYPVSLDRFSQMSFPNQGRSFYISNYYTRGFRKFILRKETEEYYYFWYNEDDEIIYCNIKKESTFDVS
tara:strand:+ start:1934 stop:2266 length:333 start_codon:yes stop_codon:yes gene_type:complete